MIERGRETIEAKADRVRADILSQYRTLAESLRRRGWDEVARMGRTRDPASRAASHCAFQLYGAAATELDGVIADLSDRLRNPYTGLAGADLAPGAARQARQ